MRMKAAADNAKEFVYRYRWVMLALLVIAYFFVYFQRMSVNAMGGDIISDIGSGSKETLSSVYFWTYALMQIPSGILADRIGPRRATTIFLSIAAVGSFLTVISTTFPMLIVGKMLIAVGMAVIYIPLMKIISVWFGKEDFPQLNGIVIAVGNVGALAAAAPLKYLSEAIGWRDVFLLLGVISVILALLCYVLIRDHPRQLNAPGIEDIRENETGVRDEDRSDAKMPVLKGLKIVASSGRVFWTMGLAYFFVYGTIMVFQGTTAINYFDTHVYDFAYAAWFITLLGVGKIVSTVLIGYLISHGYIRSKKRTMIIGSFFFALVWAIIWIFTGEIDSEWFWMCICIAFGFFGGFMTLSFSQVKEWFPISIAGTAISAVNVLLFLGAAVLTSVASVVLHTVYTADNYSTLWSIMFAVSVAAFILVLLSVEKKESDPLITS